MFGASEAGEPTRATVVDWARDLYEDLDFTAVRTWLDGAPGRKAAGYLPVYAPRELLHATGFLPVGTHGARDRLEIIRGDAFYQSYLCHLPRSVIELAQSGRLDMLSAVLFPSTCDVIRNLSGMWKLLYPDVYVRYLDVPQVPDRETGADFWESELRRLQKDLAAVSGSAPDDDGESARAWRSTTPSAKPSARSIAPGGSGPGTCLPRSCTLSLVMALKRLLRPLVRLLLSFSVQYPYLANLLKLTYVEVATREFPLEDRPQSDSRISC